MKEILKVFLLISLLIFLHKNNYLDKSLEKLFTSCYVLQQYDSKSNHPKLEKNRSL